MTRDKNAITVGFPCTNQNLKEVDVPKRNIFHRRTK